MSLDQTSPSPPSTIAQIGFLHIRMRKECDKLFRQQNFPLEMDQIPVLMSLYYSEISTQLDICSKLERDKASVNRTINFLRQRELVTVEPDDRDKRKTKVKLTPAGKRLAKQANAILHTFEDHLSGALTAAENKEFDRLMSKLTRSIAAAGTNFTLL